MSKVFQENDSVFTWIGIPPKVTVSPQGLKQIPARVVIMEGTVRSVYQPKEKHPRMLSIQIPKWPVRCLFDEKECFETSQAAKEAVEKIILQQK